jgi:hypothetical protein
MTGSITSVIDAQLANGVARSRSIIIGAILIGILLLGVTLVAGHVTLGYTLRCELPERCPYGPNARLGLTTGAISLRLHNCEPILPRIMPISATAS